MNDLLFIDNMTVFSQVDRQKNTQRLRCWANTYFRIRKYVGGHFICGSLTISLTIINKYPALLRAKREYVTSLIIITLKEDE